MDREARTRRLHFRPEVEIYSSAPDVKSFDEPLTSALHSVIESSPSSQLPGLPNGHHQAHAHHLHLPTQRYWGKASIPIRQVKEGAAHLRREYASRRRRSIHANGLSFEDDTVFPSSAGYEHDGDEEDADADADGDHSGGSPLSSGVPRTDEVDDEVDDDWAVKWEDEYERAVQDDGGPDDLVLGLMDEQEEERKRWVARQKRLAEQYAKRE